MEKLFSIGQAAKKAGITAEALRHYDRIGLVHPHRIDPWTGYRYYSEADIVRLHAVCALRCMDISLEEIKSVLALDDVDKILLFLKQAEQSAEEKISQWQEVKKRVQRAKRYYENKAAERPQKEGAFIQELPQRVILLSNRLTIPAVDNLWDYHHTFMSSSEKRKRRIFPSLTLRESTRQRNSPVYSPYARGTPKQTGCSCCLPASIYAPTVQKSSANPFLISFARRQRTGIPHPPHLRFPSSCSQASCSGIIKYKYRWTQTAPCKNREAQQQHLFSALYFLHL